MSDRRRRLSATYYAEWVLGPARDTTAMHVDTEIDTETGALLARNAFRTDFGAAWLSPTSTGAPERSPPTAPNSWDAMDR